MEVFGHRQREPDLDHRRDHRHFEREKRGPQHPGQRFQHPAERQASPKVKGLGGQAHFDPELGHARLQVRIGTDACDSPQPPRKRRASPFEQRRRQRPDGRHRQEGKLETRIEQLARVPQQIGDRHCRQQVHHAPAAEKESGDQIHREARGGARHRRRKSGNQRVQPGCAGGHRERRNLGHRAHSQQKHQHCRQHHHVCAGDHQRVECACPPEIHGPYFFEFRRLADEDRFHHAGRVIVAGIQLLDAVQRRFAQRKNGGHGSRTAAAG